MKRIVRNVFKGIQRLKTNYLNCFPTVFKYYSDNEKIGIFFEYFDPQEGRWVVCNDSSFCSLMRNCELIKEEEVDKVIRNVMSDYRESGFEDFKDFVENYYENLIQKNEEFENLEKEKIEEIELEEDEDIPNKFEFSWKFPDEDPQKDK